MGASTKKSVDKKLRYLWLCAKGWSRFQFCARMMLACWLLLFDTKSWSQTSRFFSTQRNHGPSPPSTLLLRFPRPPWRLLFPSHRGGEARPAQIASSTLWHKRKRPRAQHTLAFAKPRTTSNFEFAPHSLLFRGLSTASPREISRFYPHQTRAHKRITRSAKSTHWDPRPERVLETGTDSSFKEYAWRSSEGISIRKRAKERHRYFCRRDAKYNVENEKIRIKSYALRRSDSAACDSCAQSRRFSS